MNKRQVITSKLRKKNTRLVEILSAVDFPKSTFMYWQKKWTEEDKDKSLKDEI